MAEPKPETGKEKKEAPGVEDIFGEAIKILGRAATRAGKPLDQYLKAAKPQEITKALVDGAEIAHAVRGMALGHDDALQIPHLSGFFLQRATDLAKITAARAAAEASVSVKPESGRPESVVTKTGQGPEPATALRPDQREALKGLGEEKRQEIERLRANFQEMNGLLTAAQSGDSAAAARFREIQTEVGQLASILEAERNFLVERRKVLTKRLQARQRAEQATTYGRDSAVSESDEIGDFIEAGSGKVKQTSYASFLAFYADNLALEKENREIAEKLGISE